MNFQKMFLFNSTVHVAIKIKFAENVCNLQPIKKPLQLNREVSGNSPHIQIIAQYTVDVYEIDTVQTV